MPSRKAPLPLYYQIELNLRQAIETGRYRPGERLPTEGELQRLYGVSRITIRTAIQRLAEDGLVSTQRGRGTYVTAQASQGSQIERNPGHLLAFEEELQRQGAPPEVEVLAIERVGAPNRIANQLEIAEGEEVIRVRRRGLVGGIPLWLEARYLPPTVGADLAEAELGSASVTAHLQTIVGLPVTSSRLRISAAAATTNQAQLLQIQPGEPVLINEFAVYAEGRAIEAARAIFRADRYAFAVEVFTAKESVDFALSRAAGGALSVFRQEVSG